MICTVVEARALFLYLKEEQINESSCLELRTNGRSKSKFKQLHLPRRESRKHGGSLKAVQICLMAGSNRVQTTKPNVNDWAARESAGARTKSNIRNSTGAHATPACHGSHEPRPGAEP
jgi:hypothetical protein